MLSDDEILTYIEHPHLIGHLVGRKLLTEMHSGWIKYCWDGIHEGETTRGLMAHRGAYKTTAIDCIGCLRHMLLYPEDRIGLVRKNFKESAEILSTVHKMMLVPEIQYLFYCLHGEFPIATTKREDKVEYNFKTVSTPEGNLGAFGIETEITGKHFDVILMDDFVTINDRISKAEREKTCLKVQEIQTNIIDPGKQMIFVGTPWHKQDAWSVIGVKPIAFDCYSTGLLSEERLRYLRKKTTNSMFCANYELRHVASEDTIFNNPAWGDWIYKRSGVYGHLDAKFSGDHTNGLTFMAERNDGKIQAVGFVFNENIVDKMNYVKSKWERYFCGTMCVEENADKGFVAMGLKKQGIPVKSYHEKMNKHVKITTYLKERWDDIVWSKETDPEYMTQILDYAEGCEPDDCPDSASSLIRAKFFKKTHDDNALYRL